MRLEDPGGEDQTPLPPRNQKTKKEVSDAETFAIYQALRGLDQRQESDYRYTVFVGSTFAIGRVRDDALNPS